jgi:membrane fusion protein (multidrug efflux system)
MHALPPCSGFGGSGVATPGRFAGRLRGIERKDKNILMLLFRLSRFRSAMFLAGCLLLLLVADLSAQGRIIRVTTTEVNRMDVEQLESAVGIIESRRSPQVSAQVTGEIVAVLVDEGQGVEAGDILARIDNEQYRLAKTADEAEVRRLAALHAQKTREYERSRQLFADNLIAQDQLENIEGELAALTEQLAGSKIQVADSQRQLANTQLSAPVRAEIAVRHIDVGDYLQTGAVAFDLIDIDNLRVRLPFPEYRAPQLRKGLKVRLSSSASSGAPIETEITEIRPSINPANRSISVICDFVNPGDWRPGASVRAEVVIDSRADVIMVPQISIVRRPVGDVVYVLSGNTVHEQPVERGQRSGKFIEIRGGLNGSEVVIVDGAGFLTGGSEVSIVE